MPSPKKNSLDLQEAVRYLGLAHRYIRYTLDTLFTMASIDRPIDRLDAAKAMFRVVLDGRLGPDHPATKATLP